MAAEVVGQVAPAERGATRIADRVIAKIAARAAREALWALPEGAAPPHATVSVLARAHGSARAGEAPSGAARVHISLELDYPSDIGGQCAAVRRHVIERVEALAGMEVPEVAVQVERLHSAQARAAAQGRTR
ncbi:Asp23/Gls24 family envelope stress response protein [Streptomyces spectabilis]|uniref:Asp23/Gls24 family envelope stress response protein n=1 Tax=Streptomyces spectabilis TaxID=68270 RepID=A0A516R571_STRST|nr:Asp23/Gls24 family envelope stress response protein [Streptomyces spectabilis]QDQ10806.1 Asp23/Gls24 family envelope stress response protein [Streptomyces spectabilis]